MFPTVRFHTTILDALNIKRHSNCIIGDITICAFRIENRIHVVWVNPSRPLFNELIAVLHLNSNEVVSELLPDFLLHLTEVQQKIVDELGKIFNYQHLKDKHNG